MIISEAMKQQIVTFLTSKLLPALIILIVGWILIKAIVGVEKKILEKTKRIDAALFKFITNATKIVLWIVLLLEFLKKLGVDSTSLLTVFAASGAAIALSLQGSLSNLAGGILIMITRPFVRVDYVACAGIEGVIDTTDLLYTTLITADGKTVSLPNSSLTSNTIVNYSRLGKRRVETKVSVAYGSDLELAKQKIVEYAKKSGYFLKDEPFTCDVSGYGDSGIEIMFRGWCKQENYWGAYFEMNNATKGILGNAGVEIPFPQIDIHTK